MSEEIRCHFFNQSNAELFFRVKILRGTTLMFKNPLYRFCRDDGGSFHIDKAQSTDDVSDSKSAGRKVTRKTFHFISVSFPGNRTIFVIVFFQYNQEVGKSRGS